jgi:hypothetical protein
LSSPELKFPKPVFKEHGACLCPFSAWVIVKVTTTSRLSRQRESPDFRTRGAKLAVCMVGIYFKPEIPIWVNFRGFCNGRRWYIVWPFSLFYTHYQKISKVFFLIPGTLISSPKFWALESIATSNRHSRSQFWSTYIHTYTHTFEEHGLYVLLFESSFYKFVPF